ncbi:SIR2 family NAD-dependent protein deacylase [Streptomyces sp. CA-135486]|uniref:SIR2 family NAD-dependent protein deacylase n=1 Tax=Streptomyces sp. CA-135486 TaxID=3240049 RepID=UPI003D8AB8F9
MAPTSSSSVDLLYRDDPDLSVLAAELEHGKCIVFAGAGVSIPSGLPSWPELQRTMKSRAQLRNDYSALRVADCCRQVLGNRTFNEMLAESVGRAGRPGALHRKIAELPVKLFATSNYDTLLERAIRDGTGTDPRILSLSEQSQWLYIPEQPVEPWVLKVHGCVDRCRDLLVISEEDYLSFATTYSHVAKGLHELFARHPVLFLGYSLGDWDVLNVLHHSRLSLNEDVPNRYFVGFGMELPEKRFLEQRYRLRVFDLEGPHRAGHVDKTAALLQFLDDVIERFRIPVWLRDIIVGLGGRVEERGALDASVVSLFPDFDVSAAVRLAVRIKAKRSIDIPVEPLAADGMTLRGLLRIINQAEEAARAGKEEGDG